MSRDGSGQPPSEGPAAEIGAAAKQPVVSTATVPDPCDVAAHVERENAYRAGYTDGFSSGWDVGAGRAVLGLEHALGGLPDLLGTDLLDVVGEGFAGRYRRERAAAYADPDQPCPLYGRPDRRYVPPVHRCSTCSRYDARRENRRVHGTDDFPGVTAARRSA